jgi:NAD(P)-dependent dehydrogenase (short-subunit alcohol dehydrogenase family)
MRVELAPFGVTVILVEPGVTDTALYSGAAALSDEFAAGLRPYRTVVPAGASLPAALMRRAASAEDVAAVIAKAATDRRPRARYVPGARNRLSVTLLTGLPARLGDRVKTRITGGQNSPGPVPGKRESEASR